MINVQIVHQTALHMREFARDAELPGYAEKMERAAIELEKLEAELRGYDVHGASRILGRLCTC